MLFLVAGFLFYGLGTPDIAYDDAYEVESVLDAPVMRGVDAVEDADVILETTGPSSIEGAGVEVRDQPVKTGPIVDKVAV